MMGCFLRRVEDEAAMRGPGLTLEFRVLAPVQLLKEVPGAEEKLGPFSLYPRIKGKVPRTLAALPLFPD